ncbi:ecdysteroid phosphate phosphatase isoform X2 [Oratosquilla oratoria]|uniref:ecdysteroid phosphate phosphatase isoform X2 n=1 Tax=Oratosquilla oratoria TaxID=337810 RepID=UPI003F77391E
MATLPPRRNSTPTKISKQHLKPIQILLQMGFPKHRAEKALAATGHRGVQLASDWLLAHVNDPTIDQDSPREYVLYLCPTGPLHDQIHEFWSESLQEGGWNGAHNLVPHVTLCSFFKAGDESCESIVAGLSKVVGHMMTSVDLQEPLSLEKYISPNFMGLFLNDSQAEVFKKLAVAFVKEIANLLVLGSYDKVEVMTACLPWLSSRATPYSLCAEAQTRALHLTLAYQFPSSHFTTLDNRLNAMVDPAATAAWEMRLYSRDARISGNEVHKVLYSHVAREPDELELLIGDFVYVNPESLSTSPDGWVEGTSWLTGAKGYLPINYIERVPESDAWTLHKAIPIIGAGVLEGLETVTFPRRPPVSLSLLNLLENSEGSRRSTETLHESSSIDRLHSRQSSLDQPHQQLQQYAPGDLDQLYAKVKKPKKEDPLYRFPIEGPRKVIVCRHGERVDFTFGDWLSFSFDKEGRYLRPDLNMPAKLPARHNSPHSFYKDCPLTNIGLLQAELVGEAMREKGIQIHHVFCSPSLRCVQTCTNILKGLGIQECMPIKLEPGLFEWLAWYAEGMPVWMTHEELRNANFNICTDYEPLIRPEELQDTQESCEQYYARSAYVTQSVIKTTASKGGNILLVGHAASVDVCTRQLVGGPPRSAHEMTNIIKKVPYGCTALMTSDGMGGWKLDEPCVTPATYSGIMVYDWRVLL